MKKAKAVVSLLHYGCPVGAVLEADASLIDALTASGEVDPHPGAVAHAEAAGFGVYRFGEPKEEVAEPTPVRRGRKPKTEE